MALVIGMVLSQGATLTVPYLQKVLIDDILVPRNPEPLPTVVVVICVVILVDLGLGVGRGYLQTWLGTRVALDVRERLLESYLGAPATAFQGISAGEVVYRMGADVSRVERFLSTTLTTLGANTLSLIGIVAMLAWLNWNLLLVAVCACPLFAASTVAFRDLLRETTRIAQEKGETTLSFLVDRVKNAELARIYGQMGRDTRRLSKLQDGLLDRIMRKRTVSLGRGVLSNGVVALTPAPILWIGGLQVVNGEMSVGSLVAFIQYTLLLFGPLAAFSGIYGQSIEAQVSMNRLMEFLRRDQGSSQRGGVGLNEKVEKISIQELSYSYSRQEVLRDVSIELEIGRKYAIVGPSGSGKSTLASLISGLEIPTEGDILFNDVRVRDIEPTHLRRAVTMVPQYSYMLAETVLENVRYSNPDADAEQLSNVGRWMGIEDLLEGPRAAARLGGPELEISGGQRQRVGLARAALRKTDVLVVDEGTSSLESSVEREVLESLFKVYDGSVIVIICHRLSTLQFVDEAFCLVDGRIVQAGAPRDLMRGDGPFRTLFAEQMELLEDGARR